ncbi:YpzG family protein [Bacillus niameyensis]|nr:YpzG family protein [Bacillus niameyensis]
MNRNLSPFNRGFYNPKRMDSQVNGHTQLSQNDIILQRGGITRQMR